jgi:protein regulator of cytokinesis 1
MSLRTPAVGKSQFKICSGLPHLAGWPDAEFATDTPKHHHHHHHPCSLIQKSTMEEDSSSSIQIMASPPAVRFSTSIASPSQLDTTKVKTPSTLNKTANRSRLSAFSPVHPVLTPSYTSRGSQGLVLLSPGRTITEGLNGLASTTAQQLEAIWDEVGYTSEERASQLSDLLRMFRDQAEQKISEEQAVAETFRQTIADAKEEMKALGEALKALVDPKLIRENTGQTLTDELSNLEASLEDLRADAATAKADLQECQEYLIENEKALGRHLDERWLDIESDLTARRREEFHRKAEEMKQEVTTRTGAVIQLLRDCQHLMNDLGIDGQGSESTLDQRIAGSLVRSKDSSFIMASKFETESCLGISSKALDDLSNRASELSGEKRRRKTMLQEMGAEIAMLWEQLRVPEEEQQAFTESVKGLGMDTLEKGQAELQRLKAVKGAMLGNLIDEARATIRELWEETNAADTVRQTFEAMFVMDEMQYDDKLLEKHDGCIRELQDRLEQMKPIIRIIERREDILRERMEYEELQKDSDRLKQRGAAMAKQLMEEEKMARRIKKELPKLTKILQDKLTDWRETSGEEFQYHCDVYVDVMARQEEEWVQYKNNEMQLKLKKKQEEQDFEENKYLGKTNLAKKNKIAVRPLADSNRQNNSRPSSRIRSRDDDTKPSRTNAGMLRTRVDT